MLKNLGKSFLWLLLYFALSSIGFIGAMIAVLATGAVQFPNVEDTEAFSKAITDIVTTATVPGLLVSAVLCILVFLVYKVVRKKQFDIKTIKWKESVYFASFAAFMSSALVLVLSLLASIIPVGLFEAHEGATTDMIGSTPFWLTLLTVGIMVPIMEEIIFRYGIHGTLSRSNLWVGYLVSSLLFGLIHGNLIQFIYTAILGFAMAMAYSKGQNIWYSFFMHMAFNMVSVFGMLFGGNIWYFVVIGVVALAINIFFFFKFKRVRDVLKYNPKSVEACKEARIS